jgi:hypothetical protein
MTLFQVSVLKKYLKLQDQKAVDIMENPIVIFIKH